MRVALLMIIAYHSSTNDQFERINQTIEIVIRYALMKEDVTNFIILLLTIQATINNFVNVTTRVLSNEILYEFKMTKSLNLLDQSLRARQRAENENLATSIEKERNMLRKEAKEFIDFAQTMIKIRYDLRHTSFNLKVETNVYINLHKDYTQSEIKSRKFNKQRLNLIKIIDKIEKLTYKLNISAN
jgi:hypothetical protein